MRPDWRSVNAEPVLFRALRDVLIGTSGVRRIESESMLFGRASAKALQRECTVHLFERIPMTRDAINPQPPGRASTSMRFRFESWSDHRYEPAATVLFARLYRAHRFSDSVRQPRTLHSR